LYLVIYFNFIYYRAGYRL